MPLMKMKVQTQSAPGRKSMTRELVTNPIGKVLDLSPEDAERALAQGTGEAFDEHEGCAECKKQPRGCCSLECFRGMRGDEASHDEYFQEMLKREASLRERASAERAAKSGEKTNPPTAT